MNQAEKEHLRKSALLTKTLVTKIQHLEEALLEIVDEAIGDRDWDIVRTAVEDALGLTPLGGRE